MVRIAAGLPEVEVKLRPQIPCTDLKVLGFNMGAQVVRQYRAGQAGVFLAADSARIINPPSGGLGGNTGVQDAHNVAWKLWQRCSTAKLVPRYSICLSQ
jgi:putative polyketide hydroxylase